jgi:alpha-galactosidase
MGAHIGPARAHTTGRRHGLAFRSATALFGHLGIEWDLRRLDDTELAALAEVLALHRRFRPLLHGGDVVRFDTEPELVAHGVYRADRREGLVSVARITTSPSLTPPPVRLPGLAPDRRYRVEHLPLPNERPGPSRTTPAWWRTGLETSGRQLASIGVQLPALWPESAVLLHLEAR